jgi:hypothetical protein
MARHLRCSRPREILTVFQRIHLRFSQACDALRRARLGGGEVRSLCLPRPLNHHIMSITQSSILIRIHATARTPDAVVEGLTEAVHLAIAKAHAPREGRILRMCRRRPIIVGRLDIQERMALRESRARRGHGRIHQTGQFWHGRQAPAFPASDGFIGAGRAGT